MRPPDLESLREDAIEGRMTDVERALLATLVDMEQEVETAARTGRRPDVISRVHRLRDLTASLPADSDPMLLHCLQRHSWEKARLTLEGRSDEVSHGPFSPV